MLSYIPYLLAASVARWGLVAAEDGIIGLCPADGCPYCPNTLLQQGTGYPACVIYNTDELLGGSAGDYEGTGQNKNIYFNIPEVQDSQCRTIIRSPADETLQQCGAAVLSSSGGECVLVQVKKTLMIQYCCGTDECAKAGVRSVGSSPSSLVLADENGNLVVPRTVSQDGRDIMDEFLYDHGVNLSSTLRTSSEAGIPIFQLQPADVARAEPPLNKRDCDTFIPDGEEYTKLSLESKQISAYICGSTTIFEYTNEMSIARTTSFSASVGDPFGIVSASVGFETTEETSQSYNYQFQPKADQCGHISWTAKYRCRAGQITGCADGPQEGEVCTAAIIDANQIDGVYQFVQTG